MTFELKLDENYINKYKLVADYQKNKILVLS